MRNTKYEISKAIATAQDAHTTNRGDCAEFVFRNSGTSKNSGAPTNW